MSETAPHDRTRRTAGLFFIGFLVLYAATASRSVQWADSTHFMYRMLEGDVVGTLGLALSHPLHQWLGQLAIFLGGPDPFVITLLSALGGAATVATVFLCVMRLTGRLPAACFAAGSLGLASTVWRVSTITEVYSISAALLAGTCWGIIKYGQDRSRWALWLACLLNGLGGANDIPSGLTMPILLALVIIEVRAARLKPTDGLIAAGVFLIGVMPYGALVLAEWFRSGDLLATVRSALFGTMWSDQVLGSGLSRRVILVDIGYPLMNFPNLLLPAAAYGLFRAKALGVGTGTRRSLIAILVIHALFALRYDIVEQYNFFLPMYVLLALFGGIGAAGVLRWHGEKRWIPSLAVVLLLMTPITYAVSTSLAREYDVLGSFIRNKPYRDDYTYLMIPWSFVDRSADAMSRHALTLAGADGRIVFEDHMAHWCVRYMARLQGRAEPEMSSWKASETDRFIREARSAGRTIVLLPRNRDRPEFTPPIGRWQRNGDLYVLVDEEPTRRSAAPEAERAPESSASVARPRG